MCQDYAEAARLRDMVKSLQGEDPVVRLKTLMEKAIMEKAIAEEQYEVSSKLSFKSEWQLIVIGLLNRNACF
jgi:hypothetical protein